MSASAAPTCRRRTPRRSCRACSPSASASPREAARRGRRGGRSASAPTPTASAPCCWPRRRRSADIAARRGRAARRSASSPRPSGRTRSSSSSGARMQAYREAFVGRRVPPGADARTASSSATSAACCRRGRRPAAAPARAASHRPARRAVLPRCAAGAPAPDGVLDARHGDRRDGRPWPARLASLGQLAAVTACRLARRVGDHPCACPVRWPLRPGRPPPPDVGPARAAALPAAALADARRRCPAGPMPARRRASRRWRSSCCRRW